MEILDANSTDTGGYKEVIASISGDRVFSKLKWEAGTHRVQRVPATEAQGRIHTSAVTVAIMMPRLAMPPARRFGRAACA